MQFSPFKNPIYFLLFAIYLLLQTACQPEQISLPDTGRKIVLNGLINSDSLIRVYVGKSIYISDSDGLVVQNLDNAKVYIYQNGLLIDSLQHDFKGINWGLFYPSGNYYSKKVKPLPGKEYRIVAKIPGLPDVSATAILPNPVKIEKVDAAAIRLAPYNQDALKCNIKFADPLNETNYYLVEVFYKYGDQITPIISERFTCKDPVVEEYLSDGSIAGGNLAGVVFSDKVINGKTYSLNLTIWRNPARSGDGPRSVIYFHLYSISENYFKYIRTLNLYSAKHGKPLSEPVQVFSNITGGYGIFAGAAVSCDSLVFNN
ncbi:MAG TPA: DUF4249 domain-containing protein [Prolixibacteraceae bacterium]